MALTNSLERLSYTAKDGQYLRWDFRSEKTIKTNSVREKKGKPPLKVKLNKGLLPNVNEVLLLELENYLVDIENIQMTIIKLFQKLCLLLNKEQDTAMSITKVS